MGELELGWRIVFGMGAAAIPAVFVPSYVMFAKYKDHPVIHNRGFWSVTTAVFAISMYAFVTCIRFASLKLSCISVVIPSYLALVHVNFLVERCFLLVANLKAALQAKEYAEAKAAHLDDDFKMGWFLRNKSWFHHGWLSATKMIAVLTSWIHLIVLLSIVAQDPTQVMTPSESEECKAVVQATSSITNIFLGIPIFCVAICVYQLKSVKENFGIRQELRNIGILIGCGLVLYAVNMGAKNQQFDTFTNLFYSVIVPITEVLISLTTVIFLVKKYNRSIEKKKSRVESPKSKSGDFKFGDSHHGSTAIEKLKDILSDEKSCKLLIDFLIQEFSAENIFFLKAVEEYRNAFAESTSTPEKQKKYIHDIAKEIFKKYISQESKLSVNISAYVRRNLQEVMDKSNGNGLQEDMFQAAEVEVMTLIAEDSLRRFLRSGALPATSSLRISVSGSPTHSDMTSGTKAEERDLIDPKKFNIQMPQA